MKAFYDAFYTAIAHSQAHAAFCTRVFGRDLGQHGFADVAQLDLLAQVTGLGPGDHALDLGCGNGKITAYLAERTGAHFTGLDYSEEAIRQAQERVGDGERQLCFVVGDLNRLALPPASFDVVLAIDTIYFSDDYAATIGALAMVLRPGGRLGLLYAYGREPWVSRAAFPAERLQPAATPLADALRANGLIFRTWNLTREEYALAVQRKAVLEELHAQFAAEGNKFICEQRMGDAEGIRQAIEEGLHARYLYVAQSPARTAR
jgi:cyclopropane fatty-acyl-phospholipid synthase-like methyltransferase